MRLPGHGGDRSLRRLRRAALVNESTPAGSLFVNRRGRQMSPRDVRRVLDRRSPVPTIRMRSATPMRPISSTAGRTCGSCRSCSATRACGRLRSTPTCPPIDWSERTEALIRELDDIYRDRPSPDRRGAVGGFKSTADQSARDRLILHYSPLVKYVGRTCRGGHASHVDYSDS